TGVPADAQLRAGRRAGGPGLRRRSLRSGAPLFRWSRRLTGKPQARSLRLNRETNLVANGFRQAFEQATMFGEHAEDRCHIRLDPREALRRGAFGIRKLLEE